MRKILFLCAISIMVLTGCSQMEDPNISNEKSTTGDSHFVDLETALDNVDFVLRDLGIESTRSGLSMIKDVEYVMKPHTRSGENNTDAPKYYLVNFKDDKGFVMLSADDRLPELMAFSDSGSISLSDTTFNPLLKMYIEMPIDTTIVRPDPRPDTPKTEYVCEPLIRQTVSRWGQENPFNKTFIDHGYNMPTGCGPLACGIFMACFKYPSAYNGIDFPWNDMYNTPGHSKIADFLYEIAKKCDVTFVSYADETPIKPNKIPEAFTAFGYKSVVCESLSSSSILNIMRGNVAPDKKPFPVIVSGYSSGNLKPDGSVYGHGWVIDGLYKIKYSIPIHFSNDGDTEYFMHCVWGYYGNGNGYYLYSEKLGGYANSYDLFDKTQTSPIINYDTNLKIYYGFPGNL